MVLIELDVLPQHAQIRERCKIIHEVGGVVPNVDVITNSAPALKSLAKAFAGLAAALRQRMVKVAGDGAKTNANVLARLCNGGSLTGVKISKGIDHHVGIILCDIAGKGIAKAMLSYLLGLYNKLGFSGFLYLYTK